MAKRLSRQELSMRLQNRNLKTLLEENPAFRRFVWTILKDAGIFYPTYSPRSPYDTAFAEGRRAMGLEVMHMLKHIRPDVLAIVEAEGNLLDAELQTTQPLDEAEDDLPPTADE